MNYNCQIVNNKTQQKNRSISFEMRDFTNYMNNILLKEEKVAHKSQCAAVSTKSSLMRNPPHI